MLPRIAQAGTKISLDETGQLFGRMRREMFDPQSEPREVGPPDRSAGNLHRRFILAEHDANAHVAARRQGVITQEVQPCAAQILHDALPDYAPAHVIGAIPGGNSAIGSEYEPRAGGVGVHLHTVEHTPIIGCKNSLRTGGERASTLP